MKYRDPSTVCCPACALSSDHSVKDLLALRAQCPGCGRVLADVGENMQQGLDNWSGFLISAVIQNRLEAQNPHLNFGDTLAVSEDRFSQISMRDLMKATEALLSDMDESDRGVLGFELVKAAFRAEFPEAGEPLLDTRLVEFLADQPIDIFGRSGSNA